MDTAQTYQSKYTPQQKARVISIAVLILWIIILLYPFFTLPNKSIELKGVIIRFGIEESITEASVPPQSEINENTEETKSSDSNIDREYEKSNSASNIRESEANDQKLIDEESPISINQENNVEIEDNAEDSGNSDVKTPNEIHSENVDDDNDEKTLEEAKSEFQSYFKNANSDSQDSESNREGDSKSTILEGLIEGKSNVDNGLQQRGVLREPEIEDDSQKTGIVVVKVCVNEQGEVTSAKYTLRGSTTSDLQLIKIAENAARQYLFSPSTIEEQCGQIVIDFKLK